MDIEARILQKLDDVQAEVSATREEMRVGFATLPSRYVPRSELNSIRKEAQAARRWAIGLAVPMLVSLGTIMFNIF